jgi:hypothetical protein
LQGLQDKGVDLFLHQQGLDTSTTAGKAMFQMLGVFAEFERGIIRERVNAGLARARQNGTKLGRRRVKPSSRLPGRSAPAPALSKGSSWRPPDSVETVAFDCRRAVQILSMNHCVRCRWCSCHDVAPLGYLKELPKHSKREAFWRYVLLLLQNCCVMTHCVN